MLLALPLDARRDWFECAETLGEFLDKYFEAGDDTYGEEGRCARTV
ncbi:MAG: hypothetical protein JNK82_21785 [Myxococcaceae bacterium]|nr:hypothetical protein [Myxococcaceae bacterium]